MSLDISLSRVQRTDVFSANITHNLADMAREAGIYEHLWHPERAGVKIAGDLIPALRIALECMKSDPARFRAHNAPNGWGLYENFVPWLDDLLEACIKYPDAQIESDI